MKRNYKNLLAITAVLLGIVACGQNGDEQAALKPPLQQEVEEVPQSPPHPKAAAQRGQGDLELEIAAESKLRLFVTLCCGKLILTFFDRI